MACSKFEYVKAFEKADALLPDTYIVCRVDGRAFTKSVQIFALHIRLSGLPLSMTS